MLPPLPNSLSQSAVTERSARTGLERIPTSKDDDETP